MRLRQWCVLTFPGRFNESPGAYTLKTYAEPGPNAVVGPSDHNEGTFMIK